MTIHEILADRLSIADHQRHERMKGNRNWAKGDGPRNKERSSTHPWKRIAHKAKHAAWKERQ